MLKLLNPLCDRDLHAMSEGGVVGVSVGLRQVHPAYLCGCAGCHRCYNVASGYFDYIGGIEYISDRQILCVNDAHAMYLASVREDGHQLWRCPDCDGIQ